MLRKIRIIIAIIIFSLLTLLFLDFTGTLHQWFGGLARIQFIPAFLAVNIGLVVGIVVFTLLFGRVYCSTICPLGVFQDIVSWFSKRVNRRKKYKFSAAKNILRYVVLGIFVLGMIFGATAFIGLIEPYSAYARIANSFLAPLYKLGNNLLASWTIETDIYTFNHVDIWAKSIIAIVAAAVTFVVITVLAWLYGRTYCNTFCPVGTMLSFAGRYAMFRVQINESACNSCGLCSTKCKASCIDTKSKKIDYSRCIDCFDCIDVCRQGAISMRKWNPAKVKTASETEEKQVSSNSRRQFLATVATTIVTAPIALAQEELSHSLQFVERKKPFTRTTPITPPGSKGIQNLHTQCTACHLCVSNCPNEVLHPATMEYGIAGLMQPTMAFDRGFCRVDCNNCASVCPTGAIQKFSLNEKTTIQIGHALYNESACVVTTDGVNCTACSRHCPTGAIVLVEKANTGDTKLMIPTIDTERCIGCGACEYYCPARPQSAIHVEGHEQHRSI